VNIVENFFFFLPAAEIGDMRSSKVLGELVANL
jgi:hypothetical protein